MDYLLLPLLLFFALSSHSEALSLTDDLGRLIDVDEPPKTIVSLSPHLTELLFDLGVGHKVVGTVSFSDYPNSAKSITRIGDASALNLERIIKLEPDLVIAWFSGGSFQSVERLIGLGFKVYVNEISTPRDIASSAEKTRLSGGPAETRVGALSQVFRKDHWDSRIKNRNSCPFSFFSTWRGRSIYV